MLAKLSAEIKIIDLIIQMKCIPVLFLFATPQKVNKIQTFVTVAKNLLAPNILLCLGFLGRTAVKNLPAKAGDTRDQA